MSAVRCSRFSTPLPKFPQLLQEVVDAAHGLLPGVRKIQIPVGQRDEQILLLAAAVVVVLRIRKSRQKLKQRADKRRREEMRDRLRKEMDDQ